MRLIRIKTQRLKGVTLLELIAVMAIIGVLSSLVIGSYLKMQRNYRLTDVSNRVTSQLQLARSMAINNGAVYEFQIGPWATGFVTEDQYGDKRTTIQSDYGMWINKKDDAKKLELYAIPKGMSIIKTGFVPPVTTVDPSGTVTVVSKAITVGFSPDGTITISENGITTTTVVNATPPVTSPAPTFAPNALPFYVADELDVFTDAAGVKQYKNKTEVYVFQGGMVKTQKIVLNP